MADLNLSDTEEQLVASQENQYLSSMLSEAQAKNIQLQVKSIGQKIEPLKSEKKIFFKYLFAQGGSQTPHPFFLPTSFLYVNLVAREHRMSFRTLAPRLTVLDIPYFADAYSRTVRPIDLHNF